MNEIARAQGNLERKPWMDLGQTRHDLGLANGLLLGIVSAVCRSSICEASQQAHDYMIVI